MLGPPRGGDGLHTLGVRLRSDLRPWERSVALLPGLESCKAVLEIVEPFDQLCVSLGIEKDSGQTPALRNIERLVALTEGIEFPSELCA
jgi:hypothetical protein